MDTKGTKLTLLSVCSIELKRAKRIEADWQWANFGFLGETQPIEYYTENVLFLTLPKFSLL